MYRTNPYHLLIALSTSQWEIDDKEISEPSLTLTMLIVFI